jgi:hypothetical protein
MKNDVVALIQLTMNYIDKSTKTIGLCFALFFTLTFTVNSQTPSKNNLPDLLKSKFYTDSRPWTRWWWFASEIKKEDISDNLKWLKKNGFGGVEIAWVYPLNRMKKDTLNYTPRQKWLSPEWSAMVADAKHCADSLGLGCDFTFGSLWPFGDLEVPFDEATRNMKDPKWRQEITASWDYPKKGYVLDHLNKVAFYHYAKRTGDALKPALKGSLSGIFCDSWEVETKHLSTKGFIEKFSERYSYSLIPYIDSLYTNKKPYPSVRYDYMKLLSEYVIEDFYKPFTEKSHELGAYSRVQCSGAPADIISSYATVDIPESEALLYEPTFSNIVASAAGLSGKKIVSSETFTCLYGWPRDHHSEEQTADLKLLADALFANGVNHIIWHGKPFNPKGQDTVKFYASVHVGETGSLAPELPAFNKYLEKVSSYMKKGVSVSKVAVYLPTEDSWIAGELPPEKQMIWAWGAYEQRYTYLPDELKAWRPLWINGEFLQKAEYNQGILKVGDLSFSACYVDVRYMDISSLKRLTELAEMGLPLCLKQKPSEPGFHPRFAEYQTLLNRLSKLNNVKSSWQEMVQIPPLVAGNGIGDFWCRETEDGLTLFFANHHSQGLKFPMEYGQSLNNKSDTVHISINFKNNIFPYTLVFKPYQSILLKLGTDGKISSDEIGFTPKKPIFIPRPKVVREKWEIDIQNKP